MLIDPLVIGELENRVHTIPVAFNRRPVAYAAGSPTIKVKEMVSLQVDTYTRVHEVSTPQGRCVLPQR